MTHRILVAGSRAAHPGLHTQVIADALDEWFRHHIPINVTPTLVHGACHLGGVDSIAAQLTTERDWTVEPHPARDFGTWPSCGPRRNEHMCQLGADVLLAFPGADSRGTRDCIDRALRHGIHVRIYPLHTAQKGHR